MKTLVGALVVSTLSGCLMWSSLLAQQSQEYEPRVKVAPEYPETALAEGLEGYVVVEYTITEEGTVESAKATESSNPIFDEAAVESVNKFEYRPRILNDEPVAVPGVNVRVLFTLPVDH